MNLNSPPFWPDLSYFFSPALSDGKKLEFCFYSSMMLNTVSSSKLKWEMSTSENPSYSLSPNPLPFFSSTWNFQIFSQEARKEGEWSEGTSAQLVDEFRAEVSARFPLFHVGDVSGHLDLMTDENLQPLSVTSIYIWVFKLIAWNLHQKQILIQWVWSGTGSILTWEF